MRYCWCKSRICSWEGCDSAEDSGDEHCMKSIQIRTYFWSIFSPNTGKERPEITPYLYTFHAVEIVGRTINNFLDTHLMAAVIFISFKDDLLVENSFRSLCRPSNVQMQNETKTKTSPTDSSIKDNEMRRIYSKWEKSYFSQRALTTNMDQERYVIEWPRKASKKGRGS